MNGKTVFHVQLTKPFDGCQEYFFGSIAAIFDTLGPNTIGVTQQRLYDVKIEPGNPYRNGNCTISKGVIIRKKGNRQKPFKT